MVNPPLRRKRCLYKTLSTTTVKKLASKQQLGVEALLVTITDFNCILASSYSRFMERLNAFTY